MSTDRNLISNKVHIDGSWKTILECAAVEVLEMMAGIHPEPNASPTDEPSGEQTAMVGMAGALCGITTVRCSNATAIKLASLMLGGSSANASGAADALGEVCNMIAGNFKSKISGLADHCMLSVPTVISGEDYSMEPAQPVESMNVCLNLNGEPLWVSLIIHG